MNLVLIATKELNQWCEKDMKNVELELSLRPNPTIPHTYYTFHSVMNQLLITTFKTRLKNGGPYSFLV